MLFSSIWKSVPLAVALWLGLAVSAQAVLGDNVAAQGLIVPADGLIRVAAPGGRTGQGIVKELKVKEGDAVKAGQIIAVLQGRSAAEADVEAARRQATAAAQAPAIVQAQIAALPAQVAAAQSEVAAAQEQVKAAQAAVAQAQAGVGEAKAGVDQTRRARMEALETLDASLAKLTGTNAAYQNTLDEWDPPTREREEIKMKQKMLNEEYRAAQAPRSAMVARLDAEVARAEAAVTSAEAAVNAAQADVAIAQAQVVSAQQHLKHAEAQKAVLEAELARANASAEAAQAAIVQAEAALALTQVVAPDDGVVLHVSARAGEAVGPQGVVTLGDLSRLYVEAEVYIDDVRKLKPGQEATIESDAFEGELQGEVVEIGQLVNPQSVFSSDPLAYSDKRVVLARIKLDRIEGWQPPVHSQVIARIQVEGE